MTTVMTQRRGLVPVGRGRRFQVDCLVTEAGPLPDPGVFLYMVRDRSDPRLDAFERICTAADLDIFPMDRAQALRDRQSYYRRADYVSSYTEVEAGQAAADVITSAVDRLVSSWTVYADTFSTAGFTTPTAGAQTYTFPLEDSVPLEDRVAAYDAAVLAREAADAAVAAKTAAIARLNEQRADQVSRRVLVARLLETLSPVAEYQDALATQINGGLTPLSQLLDVVGATPPVLEADITAGRIDADANIRDWLRDPDDEEEGEADEGSVLPYLRAAGTVETNLQAAWARLRTQLAGVQLRVLELQAELDAIDDALDALDLQLGTATSELATLTEAAEAAAEAADDALASVRELCPTHAA